MDYDTAMFNSTNVAITMKDFWDLFAQHLNPSKVRGVTHASIASLYRAKINANGHGVAAGSMNMPVESQANYEASVNAPEHQRAYLDSYLSMVEDATESAGLAHPLNLGARTVSAELTATANLMALGLTAEDLLKIELHKVEKQAEVAWRKEDAAQETARHAESQATIRHEVSEKYETERVKVQEARKQTEAENLTAQREYEFKIADLQSGGKMKSTHRATSAAAVSAFEREPKNSRTSKQRPKSSADPLIRCPSEEKWTDALMVSWLRATVPDMVDSFVPMQHIIDRYSEDQDNPFCHFLSANFRLQKAWLRQRVEGLVRTGQIKKSRQTGQMVYALTYT